MPTKNYWILFRKKVLFCTTYLSIEFSNIIHKKIGLGLPIYHYLPLQDGNVMAEVSVIGLGVVGRCAAKTNNEV